MLMIQKIKSSKQVSVTALWSRIPYQQFLKSTFWSVLGAIFLRSQVIIVSIFVSKILPLHEFGQLGLLRSTIGTFSIFASVGVSLGATKFVSEALANSRYFLKSWIRFSYFITLATAALLSGSIFVFAHNLSNSISESADITGFLQLSSIVIFLATILATQIGVLNGFQSFKRVAFLNLYGSLLGIPLQVYLSYLYGINGFLIATALTTLIQILFYQYIITSLYKNHKAPFEQALTPVEKKKFLNFCIPAALSAFLVSPVSWYCNTILVKGNNGYHEMAFFDIANNWRMVLIFLPATISQVILPNITAMEDNLKLKKVLNYNLVLNGAVALLSTLFLVLISYNLLGVYGAQYLEGQFAFNLLIASTVFVALGNVIGQLIAGKLSMWYGFAVNIVWAILLIALCHYFINTKQMGAAGLAWAYFISYLVHTMLQGLLFRLYFKNNSNINERLSV